MAILFDCASKFGQCTSRRCIINPVINSILVSALLLLSGCILIPIPWDRDKPGYTQEQLAKIQVGHSREQIATEFGKGNLQRLNGRYWVYYWTEESGMLFAFPLFLGGNRLVDAGSINFKRFILFLEFDNNGLLISKQFGIRSAENPLRYCTANSLCLEHKSGGSIYEFDSLESAFTINGAAKDSVPWSEIAADRCVVVLWPNAKDWKNTHGVRQETGNRPYSGISYWLPVDSYVVLSLSPGQNTLRAICPEPYSATDNMATFNCEAGQTAFLEVGAVLKARGGWLSMDQVNVELKSIDQETGWRTIADMPRLLPP